MRRLLLPALLLAAAGCQRPPDPFAFVEPTLSVHGLVAAGDSVVHVSFIPGEEHPGIGGGAAVTLDAGDAPIALREVPHDSAGRCWLSFEGQARDGWRCYAARLPQPVAPGTAWRLDADLASGEAVTGTTRVPAAPAIVRPAERERVAYHPLGSTEKTQFDVEWATDGAPRVEIRLADIRAYRGGVMRGDLQCSLYGGGINAAVGQPSGTRRVELQGIFCLDGDHREAAWDSVATRVVVTAYDSAYAEFALHGESVTKRPNASLRGAYGVFGSAASSSREIVFVPAGTMVQALSRRP